MNSRILWVVTLLAAESVWAASNQVRLLDLRTVRASPLAEGKAVLRGSTHAEVPIALERGLAEYRLTRRDAGAATVVSNAFTTGRGATNLTLELNKTYLLQALGGDQAAGQRGVAGTLLSATASPNGGVRLRKAQLFVAPREDPVPWDRSQMAYATKLTLGVLEENPNDAAAFLPLTLQLFGPAELKLEPATTEISANGAGGFKDVQLRSERHLAGTVLTVRYGTFEQSTPLAFADANWLLRFLPAWCWVVVALGTVLGVVVKLSASKGKLKQRQVLVVVAQGVSGALVGMLAVQSGLLARFLGGGALGAQVGATALLVCILAAFLGGPAVLKWLWSQRNPKEP